MSRRARRTRYPGIIDPKLITPATIFPTPILYGYLFSHLGISLNGEDVSSWLDLYNINNYAQGSASNQPAYLDDGSEAGGLPVLISTDAGNEYLEDASPVALADASRPSMMAVARFTAYQTRSFCNWQEAADANTLCQLRSSSGGAILGRFDLTDGNNAAATMLTGSSTTAHFLEAHADPVAFTGAADNGTPGTDTEKGTTKAAFDLLTAAGSAAGCDVRVSHHCWLKAQPIGGIPGNQMTRYRSMVASMYSSLDIAL